MCVCVFSFAVLYVDLKITKSIVSGLYKVWLYSVQRYRFPPGVGGKQLSNPENVNTNKYWVRFPVYLALEQAWGHIYTEHNFLYALLDTSSLLRNLQFPDVLSLWLRIVCSKTGF